MKWIYAVKANVLFMMTVLNRKQLKLLRELESKSDLIRNGGFFIDETICQIQHAHQDIPDTAT